MQGSLRQRGDAWQVRVYAGRDPMTDAKRYVTRTVRGGKREAQRVMATLVAEVDQGVSLGTDAAVGQLLERWFELASPNWSPRTVVQNRSILDAHVLPRLAKLPLEEAAGGRSRRLYATLRSAPGRKGASMSASTIRRIHVVLHAALAQGVKWGWISTNPATSASPPKVGRSTITSPTPEAVHRVLADVESDDADLYAYLRLAISTGARRSQLCGLQWRDVGLGSGAITFARAVVDGPAGITLKGTKTDSTYRVSLDAATLAVLVAHRQRSEQRAATCGVGLLDDGFVFSYEPDGAAPWRPDGVTHRWTRARSRAGLPEVRLHDLRHFTATTMLGAGVPVSIGAGRLGHARAATTLNVYAHFIESGDKLAAEALGAVLEAADPRGPGA